MNTMQDPWEMTRNELESTLETMRAMNPNEMTSEELARYNAAMAALDAWNDPYA